MLEVLSIVGARPQFIKAAPVSKALRQAGHSEFLVHTGQHYDHVRSQVFFEEMGIPEPDIKDVARANILALKSNVTDEFFNIGMGVKTSIDELVQMLLKITDSDLQPEYRPQEQMFVTHRVGSTEKAERMLGFRASTPLSEGLRSVIEWRRLDQQRVVSQPA